MKILVINNDVMERTIIQQVLQYNKHEIIPAGNSETAMRLLQEGDIRFVIADRGTTDIDEQQFIKKLRDANPPYYIYILLIASKVSDTDVTTPRAGADDYLHKPIVPLELKSRVHIGERILGLGDNLVQAKGALEQTAMFDPLTNMLNQKAFLNLSRGELERARRNQAPLSLIVLDIDNFNEIKAKYGEDIGNDVLLLVAQAIREKSRPYDGVGRYEDAMFLIPLPGVIGQDAEKIGERILKGILNTNISMLDGTALNINISVGVVASLRVTVNMEVDTFIQKGKEIISAVKRNGGNQVDTMFI
jgi:two-component system chemotaxis response regulator CheY